MLDSFPVFSRKPSFFVLILSCSRDASESSMNEYNIYVGTYTNGDSEGIYRFSFNVDDGAAGDVDLIAKTSNPSYLTLVDEGEKIIAVSEVENGAVYLFAREQQNYRLVDEVETGGSAPCYIDYQSELGQFAIANYTSGNVRFGSISDNGFRTYRQVMYHRGEVGSNTARQESAHAHFAGFNGDDVYAVDLGTDEVLFYEASSSGFDQPQTALELEDGDGPRHLEFHPSGQWVYILNELTSTIVACQVDPESGFFSVIDRHSTLPEDFDGESYAADIHLSPDGKFVYCSNRGDESLAIFKVISEGKLELIGHQDVGGKWPRNFVISPDGKWVLVANEHTSNVVIFNRNTSSGMLSLQSELTVSNPTCLKFGR